MAINANDPAEIAKTVAAIVSLVGSQWTGWTELRNRLRTVRTKRWHIGKLGLLYDLIVVWPLRVNVLALMVISVMSLIAIVAGVWHLENTPIPSFFEWVFSHALKLIIAYLVVLLSLAINPIQWLTLWISGYFETVRYRPDWINAKWQLEDDEQSFAVNIDVEALERVGSLILFRMKKTLDQPDLPGRARVPADCSADELANYVLFGCTLERSVAKLYRDDYRVVDNCWNFLAGAAEEKHRVFRPETLKNLRKGGHSFYQHLLKLKVEDESGNPLTAPPDEQSIREVMDDTHARLFRFWIFGLNGRGANLSSRFWSREQSVGRVIRRLRQFPAYGLKHEASTVPEFMKIAARAHVWDKLTGKFDLLPFNASITLFLLNTCCLRTPPTEDIINTSHAEIQCITSWAEARLIDTIWRTIRSSGHDPLAVQLCQKYFGVNEPSKAPKWKVADYVDVWIYGHARKYCAKRSPDKTGASMECKFDKNDSCVCDQAVSGWLRDGHLLKRKG